MMRSARVDCAGMSLGMILGPIRLFLLLWPASALAAGIDEASRPARVSADVAILTIGGLDVPLLTAAFAVLGVLLARPIAPRGDPPLSLGKNIVVTLILCLLVIAWVIDSRPGLLFSFIMSIGLGFSGLAIIELAGTEALGVVRRIFSGINPKGGS